MSGSARKRTARKRIERKAIEKPLTTCRETHNQRLFKVNMFLIIQSRLLYHIDADKSTVLRAGTLEKWQVLTCETGLYGVLTF